MLFIIFLLTVISPVIERKASNAFCFDKKCPFTWLYLPCFFAFFLFLADWHFNRCEEESPAENWKLNMTIETHVFQKHWWDVVFTVTICKQGVYDKVRWQFLTLIFTCYVWLLRGAVDFFFQRIRVSSLMTILSPNVLSYEIEY